MSSSPPDPLLGRTINERFRITGLIARGGMGKVYRAEQAPLGRVCAVKVLNPNYAGEHDPEFHRRFFLEASTASKLTHPNTVTIFDYGRTDDDIYYMAMEYLEGHTLHRAIRESGFFPEERAAHIARQVCRALREAHSLGVIHRDLKPANIFLVQHGDESDFVKVLDFGLVKDVTDGKADELTQTGLFMGSPKYMAPEQIRGDRVDARTDIYSLGVILYEMVTGKVPFDRPSSVNILMAHVNDEVPPLRLMNPNVQVSPEIEATILRCMAKDPEVRYRSMDEVLAALKRVGGGVLTATVSGLTTGEYRTMSGSGGHAALPGAPSVTGVGQPSASGLMGSSHPPSYAPPAVSEPGPGGYRPVLGGELGGPGITSLLPPPETRGSRAVLFAAVALGIALVGGGAVFYLRPRLPLDAPSPSSGLPRETALPGAPASGITETTPSSAMAPPVAPPVIPSAVVTAAPAAPVPTEVTVRLVTEPEGASVKEEGIELCAATPCDVQYRGRDADPRREHRLLFAKAGYKVESRILRAGEVQVTLKLTRVPAGGPPPSTPQKADPAPPGYKVDVPY